MRASAESASSTPSVLVNHTTSPIGLWLAAIDANAMSWFIVVLL